MNISELISKLEKIKIEHGDLPILIKEDGFGGHAMNTFGSCTQNEMYAGDEFEENLTENDIKKIIPEYNGNSESLDRDFKYVEISSGSRIYST